VTLLERAWAEREEVVYPRLFGDLGPGIFVLDAELFREGFGVSDVDPRWLHHGVFRSPPTHDRASWAYVTSGLSNPWQHEFATPSGPSGLGKELVFEMHSATDWAIKRLQHVLAFELLLTAGHYPGRGPIAVHDRLPLHGPITPDRESSIQWLLVCPPSTRERQFGLESGSVALLTLFGITDAEASFAREVGSDELLSALQRSTSFPITAPDRGSVV
jgi:suppressor of fused protein SUFU